MKKGRLELRCRIGGGDHEESHPNDLRVNPCLIRVHPWPKTDGCRHWAADKNRTVNRAVQRARRLADGLLAVVRKPAPRALIRTGKLRFLFHPC
jgi:hypothetical protein